MSSNRAARVLLPALAMLVLYALVLLAMGDGHSAAPAETEALLHARSAALRNEMDLARNDRWFLVLDPDEGTLTLYHGATPLRAYAVLGIDAGERRFGLGRGHARADWRTARWDGSRLEPPVRRRRDVIVSDSVTPPDPAGEVDWIPPTPDEEVPTPSRFVIHFDGGLGMEVTAEWGDSTAVRAGLWARGVHRVRRFLPGNWDRYRIRVVLPASEAGALYRSLPDSTALVAVLSR